MTKRGVPQPLRTDKRLGPDLAREWSTKAVVGAGDDRPARLFVCVDPDDTGLVEIDESKTTSAGPDGRPLRGGSIGHLAITVEEARWLLRVLPEAITYLDVHLGAQTESKKKKKGSTCNSA